MDLQFVQNLFRGGAHGIGIATILIFVISSLADSKTQDELLAEKFSPILILAEEPENPGRKVIFPEPVEIMGAKSASNLWFSVKVYGRTTEGKYDQGNIGNYKYSDVIKAFPKFNALPKVDFSKNEFAFLPKEFIYRDTILLDVLKVLETRSVQAGPVQAAIQIDPIQKGSAKISSIEIAQIAQVDSALFFDPHFDYPGNKEKGSDTENWYHYYENTTHPRAGKHFKNTAYAHIFQIESSVPAYHDKFTIRYYYFYPFNDWKNNHEGDWSFIDVIITDRDTAKAELFRVNYSFHGDRLSYIKKGGRKFNPQKEFAPAEGGSHPVVYIGAGSHGSFPTGGDYPRRVWFIDLTEHLTNRGIVLSTVVDENTNPDLAQYYDLVLLPTPDRNNAHNMGLSADMSWLGAEVRWGELEVDSPLDWLPITAIVQNKSPEGPFHKSNWNKFETGSYDSKKIPHTEFHHYPILQAVTWRDTIDLMGDIVVYPGATLTIEAGTVIRAYPNIDIHDIEDISRVDIVNYGTINADASGGQQIAFEGQITEHSSRPKAGDWYGIRNYGTATLKNCKIQHSVVGLEGNGIEILNQVILANNSKNNTPHNPCDFNGDGAVNFDDFLLFVAVYGKSLSDEGFDGRMDLNGDGTINFADFLIFVSCYP